MCYVPVLASWRVDYQLVNAKHMYILTLDNMPDKDIMFSFTCFIVVDLSLLFYYLLDMHICY